MTPPERPLTSVALAQAARHYVQSLEARGALSEAEQRSAAEFGALLEAMFLLAAVDGEISDAELSRLQASVATLAELDPSALKVLPQALKELAQRLEAEGWSARVAQVVEALATPEARRTAFRLAAAIAMVDDEVAHAEAAGIDAFAAALGLDHEESQRLLREVVAELFGAG